MRVYTVTKVRASIWKYPSVCRFWQHSLRFFQRSSDDLDTEFWQSINMAFNDVALHHRANVMITSAEQISWPGDLSISDVKSAGLTTACLVRMKLFTLDDRLIIRKAGSLGASDQKKLRATWKKLLLV